MLKFCRRYFAVLFLLFCLPFPLQLIPGLQNFSSFYDEMWFQLFQWFNTTFLHLDTRPSINGSGDALDNYFTALVLLLLAIPIAFLWQGFARYKIWVDSYIRWSLAFALFSYGFTKFVQFPPLSGLRLHEPFGQASPMGLMWNFMGYSRPYTFFAGLMEVIPGILLLLPRFATLGAGLALAVLGNVFVMNLCYDVPVKLYSFQLFLLAAWILAADSERVLSFVRGKGVPAVQLLESKIWWRVNVVIALLIVVKVVANIPWSDSSLKVPYPGTWIVESPTDGPWIRMAFERSYRMTLQNKAGGTVRFQVSAGEPPGTFQVRQEAEKSSSRIQFKQPDAEHLTLNGLIQGQEVELKFKREGDTNFPLMNRGFHWVSEYPQNN